MVSVRKIKIIFYFCYEVSFDKRYTLHARKQTHAYLSWRIRNMKILGAFFILLFSSSVALSSEYTDWKGGKDAFLVVDSLNDQAAVFLKYYPEFTRYYANEALLLANQANYAKGQIEALLLLARYFRTKEEYNNILECYFKVVDIAENTDDIQYRVLGYTMIIHFFLAIKDFDLAEKYLALLAGVAKNSSDPEIIAEVFSWKATCFYSKGDFDHAISNLYLRLLYVQKTHDLNNEGNVYKLLGDAFVQKGMWSKAEYNYRIALGIFLQISNLAEIGVIYTRLAHIYQEQNDQKFNLKFNLAAMRIREQIGHEKLISSSFLNVGEAYWFLGKKDSAGFYMKKSLHLAKRIKDSQLLEAVCSQLSFFAKADGRFSDALKYFIESSEYRAKMTKDQNQQEILILEANRTIRASELQIDLLNQEVLIQGLQIRNSRIQILLFEVAFLVILSLILFINTLARKNQKRKDELKELNARLKQEIDIRINAEVRLSRSEELHRFLAENTVDVISLMDAGLNKLYISPSCQKFYGFTQQEILQMRSPLELIEPAFHVHVNQHLLEMLRSRHATRYIYKVLRKDGSNFWAEANVNPILDPATNEVKNLIKVVRNISERMKNEEELAGNSRQKEYLLHEIHNRVKNNFAILISLMNMQLDQSDNSKLSSSLTDLQLRVRAMSLVHEQLYQTQEISTIPFDNYLHHLTLIISRSFKNNRIELHTDLHHCNIAIEMALPLGLIVNELITNAYKYAFPDNQTGVIKVGLYPENEKKFRISICDNGVGLPSDFSSSSTKSMGSQIVGILVEQTEAILEVSNNGGACFRILFSTHQEK